MYNNNLQLTTGIYYFKTHFPGALMTTSGIIGEVILRDGGVFDLANLDTGELYNFSVRFITIDSGNLYLFNVNTTDYVILIKMTTEAGDILTTESGEIIVMN